MAVTVRRTTDDDFTEALAKLNFAAFDGSVISTALNPRMHEPEGARIASEIWKARHRDPNAYAFVAIDDQTGETVGYASFEVFKDLKDGRFGPFALTSDPYGNWPTEADRRWAEQLINALFDGRNDMMAVRPRSTIVSCNRMAVSPAQQRRGIGKQLLEQGISLARSFGAQMVLDATPGGLRLYEKCGFIAFRQSDLAVSEEFADRPVARSTCMYRPQDV